MNEHRPFFRIYGEPPVPGAVWEQDGRYYRGDKSPCAPEKEPPPPIPEEEPPDVPNMDLDVVTRWGVVPEYRDMTLDQVRKLHWKQLQKIMRMNGQEWEGREQALEWICG